MNIVKTNLDLMVFILEIISQKLKKGTHAINLDEYTNIGTHWIVLFFKPKYTIYFYSFGIEHISKEIKKFIGNKDIKANIFRLQAYD